MITLNMTAGDDNELITIFKFVGNTNAILATKDIALSGFSYDGQVLHYNTDFSLGVNNNIVGGGGVGSVSEMRLAIAKNVDNTSFDDFYNEFYPNTTKYLISSVVYVGVVWEGATTESQITWLYSMRVIDYSYTDTINITLSSYMNVDLPQIPYYKIQKDFDNYISYFPECPEDNLGRTLPLVYGTFDYDTLSTNAYYLTPFPQHPAFPLIYVGMKDVAFGSATKWAYQFVTSSHSISNTEYRDTTYYNQVGVTTNNNTDTMALLNYDDELQTWKFLYGKESGVHSSTQSLSGNVVRVVADNYADYDIYGDYHIAPDTAWTDDIDIDTDNDSLVDTTVTPIDYDITDITSGDSSVTVSGGSSNYLLLWATKVPPTFEGNADFKVIYFVDIENDSGSDIASGDIGFVEYHNSGYEDWQDFPAISNGDRVIVAFEGVQTTGSTTTTAWTDALAGAHGIKNTGTDDVIVHRVGVIMVSSLEESLKYKVYTWKRMNQFIHLNINMSSNINYPDNSNFIGR